MGVKTKGGGENATPTIKNKKELKNMKTFLGLIQGLAFILMICEPNEDLTAWTIWEVSMLATLLISNWLWRILDRRESRELDIKMNN